MWRWAVFHPWSILSLYIQVSEILWTYYMFNQIFYWNIRYKYTFKHYDKLLIILFVYSLSNNIFLVNYMYIVPGYVDHALQISECNWMLGWVHVTKINNVNDLPVQIQISIYCIYIYSFPFIISIGPNITNFWRMTSSIFYQQLSVWLPSFTYLQKKKIMSCLRDRYLVHFQMTEIYFKYIFSPNLYLGFLFKTHHWFTYSSLF